MIDLLLIYMHSFMNCKYCGSAIEAIKDEDLARLIISGTCSSCIGKSSFIEATKSNRTKNKLVQFMACIKKGFNRHKV